VTLQDVKQTGSQGIVTALHHVPHGDIWTVDEIKKRQEELKTFGYNWDVVESVTIHEDIKTRSGNYKKYIDQYKTTLKNLASCDIDIVTYNFMPVNDWTRTNLDYPMSDGSKALYFVIGGCGS
jgi:mannonate dehydratase